MDPTSIERRADALFEDQQRTNYKRVDRIFAYLMVVQWIAAILLAVFLSPYAWAGKERAVHVHVWAAVLLGGAITSLPVLLALFRPGAASTRHVVAVGQMLWSALLIHLSGGRIETHFHVFGSLAFLAFYRDWRVLVPATITVAADHLVRQIFWPESVYGIVAPETWRFLEHAFWVVFEDVVLVMSCLAGVREMRALARRQAEGEALLAELKASHEALVRGEKLAAVGQLAASVGHELRNPLAAVRNACAYLERKLGGTDVARADARVPQFFRIVDRELSACTKIIGDLLDFARERPPALAPCPLEPLVAEAIQVVESGNTKIENAVPRLLPVPDLDREQFRQILINLLQNAVEAIPHDRTGFVEVRAHGRDDGAVSLVVTDNGGGIPSDVVPKIFEPLYTTKTRGTGLGLAVVSTIVKRHNGTIHVDSEAGRGTTFRIDLPPPGIRQEHA